MQKCLIDMILIEMLDQYKNCLIDTELTLSATTANKSRYKWILGLEEIIQYAQAHPSAAVMKKLSVSKLHNLALSLPHENSGTQLRISRKGRNAPGERKQGEK